MSTRRAPRAPTSRRAAIEYTRAFVDVAYVPRAPWWATKAHTYRCEVDFEVSVNTEAHVYEIYVKRLCTSYLYVFFGARILNSLYVANTERSCAYATRIRTHTNILRVVWVIHKLRSAKMTNVVSPTRCGALLLARTRLKTITIGTFNPNVRSYTNQHAPLTIMCEPTISPRPLSLYPKIITPEP